MNQKTQLFPVLPDQVPSRGSPLSRAIFKKLFLAQGWKFDGEFPNLAKAVAIISPHTSNIDAWHGFLALLGIGIKITIFGKNTLFDTPLKPLLDWVGVIPVQRENPHGLTREIAEIVQATDQIWIGMAPEGTRKKADKIRSGFYYIAYEAQIPIVMFSFDYAKKTIHCLGVFEPNGDFETDLEKILKIYDGKFSPKNPEWLALPLQKHWKKP
ncbi:MULTISPECIES: 1-acyl-sn-glycerol-3-phosphate acyltransferase [Acinetobacter]|uniref:1-acyl-sn-glycerol-3-phosphate acyltransferase n=1 Tax=Acinetobacter TaxID=469 RepID=UPI000994506C|nr:MULTISPECIES: 1-acyl-sn-glycerol-3-phosphate acyltransferase [Acinetobacter]MCL6246122.1 1-acyl-sn-glycerol-3-phosphate acyltransferase [Acinetobacter amyesii]OOV82171.1 acyltransferase [Acinetobacter sp. ANC 5600]